jgi:hypothetical protein
MKKFKYRRSRKIMNWGCSFDSLTELKYAISIFEECEFLRARVAIFYDPVTKKPTDYIREFHRRYTPDFLIRHKVTRESFLIEVKPAAFRNDPQLSLRKEVAENYIKWKGYDWKFKIVFDDEIMLTAEQLAEFDDACKLKSKASFRLWFQEYNRKFDRSAPLFFSTVPKESSIQFVMLGTRRHSLNLFSSSG